MNGGVFGQFRQFVEHHLAGNVGKPHVANDKIQRIAKERRFPRSPFVPTVHQVTRQPSSSRRWTIEPPMTGSSSTRPICARVRQHGLRHGFCVLPGRGNEQRDRRPSLLFCGDIGLSAEIVNHATNHPEPKPATGTHGGTGVLIDENAGDLRAAFQDPDRRFRSSSACSVALARQRDRAALRGYRACIEQEIECGLADGTAPDRQFGRAGP